MPQHRAGPAERGGQVHEPGFRLEGRRGEECQLGLLHGGARAAELLGEVLPGGIARQHPRRRRAERQPHRLRLSQPGFQFRNPIVQLLKLLPELPKDRFALRCCAANLCQLLLDVSALLLRSRPSLKTTARNCGQTGLAIRDKYRP